MFSLFSILRQLINDASISFAPRRCAICGRRLLLEEEQLCLSCFSSLPFTHLAGKSGNKVERLFWGQFPIVRANALMYYYPHTDSSHAVLALKYHHRPQIGVFFGKVMAEDLKDTDFFKGIDQIVPVPLAKQRLKERGYNQSEMLAKGISLITHIPIDTTSVVRSFSNLSQTRVDISRRKENVKGIFMLTEQHQLDNRHVLLVDDILTTGATLISCAQTMAQAQNIRISVLTLGLAGGHPCIEKHHELE